jgi:CHASE2 domain-containing sensor protein
MTEPRSAHLAMYGMVGVAMHLVVGVLIVASYSVISSGWLVTLIGAWLIATGAGAVLWRRTVWVPLLASIVLSAAWMTVFFGSR